MGAFTGDDTCVWRLKPVLRHQYTVPSTNRHISCFIYSYLFKQVSIVLWKIGLINTTYVVPPQGHLLVQTRDNSNTRFFHT